MKEAVEQGCEVEMLQGPKLNGLNVQISFSGEASAWVIGTKNIALVARDKKELDKYPHSGRHRHSTYIGQVWFQMLEEQSKAKVEELKKELSDSTLVGEYIGNPDTHNLVGYPCEQIVFFGLVDNSSGGLYSPRELAKVTSKYQGMEQVDLKAVGMFSDAEKLGGEFRKVIAEVGSGKLSEVEEGQVVYFVRRDKENSYSEEVVALWKVKSVEYNLLVNLKDKIRYFFTQKQAGVSSDSLIQRFIKESKALQKEMNAATPNPLDFYQDLCINSFKVLQRGNRHDQIYFKELFYESFSKFVKEVIALEKKNSKAYHSEFSFFSKKSWGEQKKGAKEDLEEEKQHFHQKHEEKIHPKHQREEPEEEKKSVYQQKKPQAQQKSQYQQKQKKTSSSQKTIILIAPPFSISKEAMEALNNEFDFMESQDFTPDLIEKSGGSGKMGLVYQASLKGLEEHAVSEQEHLFYVQYGFEGQSLTNNMVNTFIKNRKEMYCPRFLEKNKNGQEEPLSLSRLQLFKNQQLEIAQKTLAHLSTLSNYQSGFQREDEVMVAISKIIKDASKDSSKDPAKVLPKEYQPKDQNQPREQAKEQGKKGKNQQKKSPKEQEEGEIEEEEEKIYDQILSRNKNQLSQSLSNCQSQVLVLVPLGIPGTGKTYFAQNTLKPLAESLGARFFSISSDDIRAEIMGRYMKKNNVAQSHAFKATGQEAGKKFDQEFKRIMALAQTGEEPSILLVDKNHPPNAIKKTVDAARKTKGRVKVLALAPECKNKPDEYPFSFSMFIQCYLRCAFRDDHQTLSNEDPEMLARVQFGFFKAYHRLEFDSSFLSKHGFDGLLSFPFTHEHELVQLPANLESCIKKGLDICTGWTPDPHPVYVQFYKMLFAYRQLFGGSSKEEQKDEGFKDQLLQALKEETPQAEVQQPEKQVPRGPEKVQVEEEKQLWHEKEEDEEESKEEVQMEKQESQTSEKGLAGQNQEKNKKKKKKKAKQEPSQMAQSQKEFKPYRPQGLEKTSFQDDFKTVQKQKQQVKKGMLPLYLGLSFQSDPLFNKKMETLLVCGLDPFFKANASNELMKEFHQNIIKLGNAAVSWENGWKKPDDFHVTCLFVGRNEDNTDNDIYQNFTDGEQVEVEIVAIVVVPSKIVVGVCFPSYPVDNKCPHVTLLTNDWKPKDSNAVLEQTCLGEKKVFSKQYQQLKNGKKGESEEEEKEESGEIVEGKVKLNQSENGCNCYFVTLARPVSFAATTKTYYK